MPVDIESATLRPRPTNVRLKNFVIPTRERSETGGTCFLPGDLKRRRYLSRTAAQASPALSSRPEHERPKDGHAQSRDLMPVDPQQRPVRESSDLSILGCPAAPHTAPPGPRDGPDPRDKVPSGMADISPGRSPG
jgi:hypothetical protein